MIISNQIYLLLLSNSSFLISRHDLSVQGVILSGMILRLNPKLGHGKNKGAISREQKTLVIFPNHFLLTLSSHHLEKICSMLKNTLQSSELRLNT